MKLSFREVFSSRIDYPHADLPSDLWDKIGKDYELKEDIAIAIKNMVGAVLSPKFKDVDKWFVTNILGSSIATQFWKDDSDLDVKVVIQPDKFVESNPEYSELTLKELKEKFLEVFDQHKNKDYFKVLNRPLDMYMASDDEIYTPDFQKRFDALYDIVSKRWIKNPKLYDIDTYDRDEVVEEGERMALEWAEHWDLDLGKIRRKLTEAQQIETYINSLEPQKAERFKQKVENLLFAMQKEIQKMHIEKNLIKQEYYNAYDAYNPDIEKVYDSANAFPEVIRMKLLVLWGYVYIIRKLNSLIETDLEPEDLNDVKQVLNNQVP